jgi:hypothetical protein
MPVPTKLEKLSSCIDRFYRRKMKESQEPAGTAAIFRSVTPSAIFFCFVFQGLTPERVHFLDFQNILLY